ncbi:MBL fold metallo-hydrolase [Rhizobium ruizarguesonis]|uniref:MBL fold metallo-hydrolase n=1 Tax=Rhizobium ruizarguesonis TaxID=2081791 RepID=UPI0013EECF74|nr:MBL fold metallo-hydrolase [Rhizobium ruizarguesonis]
MRLKLRLDWWPVGQGLFASGFLTQEDGRSFTWIYDCGTSSSDALIRQALLHHAADRRFLGNARIDLAVLSHFDHDHISGFMRLVSQSPIQTLLLPYIPLWKRLIIAIEQRIAVTDPVFQFFVDPAGFLFGIDGSDIREIIFVPPASLDDPGSVGGDDPLPDPPESASSAKELLRQVEWGEAPEEYRNDVRSLTVNTRVAFLAPRGRIFLPFWEFLPYNDAQLTPKATPGFLNDVAPLVAAIVDPATRRSSQLSSIKRLYNQHFGKSSKLRNQISLFLYSGPLGNLGMEEGSPFDAYHLSDRFSQMMTGDGLLDTGPRLDAFLRYYRSGSRLARSGIFQVMHHGARSSSRSGLADAIMPVVSIFSSDPADRRYGHPHSEVLRDFWTYGPRQVDTVRGLRLELRLFLHTTAISRQRALSV